MIPYLPIDNHRKTIYDPFMASKATNDRALHIIKRGAYYNKRCLLYTSDAADE